MWSVVQVGTPVLPRPTRPGGEANRKPRRGQMDRRSGDDDQSAGPPWPRRSGAKAGCRRGHRNARTPLLRPNSQPSGMGSVSNSKKPAGARHRPPQSSRTRNSKTVSQMLMPSATYVSPTVSGYSLSNSVARLRWWSVSRLGSFETQTALTASSCVRGTRA